MAPFADAGITAYRAAKKAARRLPPGSRCAIVGGLGHVGVQALRALSGCDVIAVDSSENALELARELDVDEVLEADENVVSAVRELTAYHGVEAVIDFVAEHGTTEQGPAMLAQGGSYYVVGYAAGWTSPRSRSSSRRSRLSGTWWATTSS